MIVMIADNTNAQTEKVRKNSFNNNYSVCRNQSGDYICSSEQFRAQNQRRQIVTATVESQTQVIDMPTTVVLNDNPTSAYNSYYRYHNFIVNDEMSNPANGLPSQQYDGPAKNDERNINYNQTQISLRASDGSK
jgi:hypothetical protein